jgi:RNA polymerase sigma-70 factor (ECF subfamily)
VATTIHDRFEQRVVPLLDDAYTLARHLMRNEHDAQDVVQEAYLRAWRHFANFRDGDEKAWLLTIVRNCCYTWRRSQQGRDAIPYDDEQHGLRETDRLATDARAIAGSERQSLASAVATLPPEFREVLVLREIQGFSYREIAGITGAPIGTVMSRIARGREQLRRALKRTA